MRRRDAAHADAPVYPFIGSAFDGGGFAVGPGYRARYGDTGTFDAHAAWSVRNYKAADATLTLPASRDGRVTRRRSRGTGSTRRTWRSTASATIRDERPRRASAIARRRSASRRAFRRRGSFAVGGGVDAIAIETAIATDAAIARSNPTYRRTPRCSPSSTRARRPATRAAAASIASTGPTTARPTRGAAQLPARRRRSAAVRPDPARELGHRAARARVDDRRPRRAGRAVLPAAGPRRQPHAARLLRRGASATATGCC